MEHAESSRHEARRGEVEAARHAFEMLARRLDALYEKEDREGLTAAEHREVELIVNNAMVVQEILEGKQPEEFEKQEKEAA